ncbi:ABC transporter permease [uncultured Bacteroides sp.]|uniref:ABC transporter permease n=1 Tax=uncultured Bacteroides sp. TaxID=162156 RepID=UPI0025FEA9DC|nr:ABC transporter permease [uncultured Bacteroides sp.]
MIKHYLKVAFRNLMKYKTQSLVSIIGLAAGFTCFALSALWIRYEMTYDDFHEGADRIYLAGSSFRLYGDGFSYNSSSLLASYLAKNCPEVEKVCCIYYDWDEKKIKNEDAEFSVRRIEVDSSFISMFNIKVLDGDNHLQLKKDEIAITENTAKRIFGKESPIGKHLILEENNEEKTIVAIVKSWEGHSLFSFDILLPFYDANPNWGRQRCQTLFRTYPNCDMKALQQRLSEHEVQQEGHKYPISTPIALLSTLRSTHPREDVNVKLDHIRLFACISGLVIICGICNYLTMLVTRIRMRRRELALRKVNGSSNRGLLTLLLTELVLLLLLSSGVGLVLIELILPTFKRLSQIDESTSFFYIEVFVYILSLVAVTVGFASLLIQYISRRTLLNNISKKSNTHLSGWFYKISIFFQLFISLGFVFCTLVMMMQLHFLLNTRELGIERHNVGAVVYCSENIPFKEVVNQIPEIAECLNGFHTPIPKMYYSTYRVKEWDEKNTDNEQYIELEDETINQEYADFFRVEVLDGSMLDEKDGKDMIVINEAAVKALGWTQPIGKKIGKLGKQYIVKGVIKNISYNAPIHPVAPAMFHLPDSRDKGGIIFKVKEGTWDIVSEKIKAEVNKVNPNAELMLSNMEEVYDAYMKSERTLCKLLSVVSAICIIIAVFGIFSLVTLSCQQRRKEIAIRKVNGASARLILNLFFKEYLLLLVMASCIAFPLGYVIMKRWLENYVKQTPVNLWIYIGIFAGMLLVIFSSIVWRVWKAAIQNPAEVIKSE